MNYPKDLLRIWLSRQLEDSARQWLDSRIETVESGDEQKLFIAFGLTPRKVGKVDLNLTASDIADADTVRPGWNPTGWSADQAARTLLVLSFPSENSCAYVNCLDKIFSSAAVDELVALYQGLPIFPHQDAFRLRAAEGIRTNIRTAFCAVAHRNPYASEQLDEGAWNQMVLKALFVEALLDPIIGLDERANQDLATMLVDFAHERWTAGRTVSPELWRCVGPYAGASAIGDLEKTLEKGNTTEQQAAALALSSCPNERAATVLKTKPEYKTAIDSGDISWKKIAEALGD